MKRDIIVVGTSAGGLDVLKKLVRDLPADLPASIFVVWHMTPDSPGVLAKVLDHEGPLPATQAVEGEPIKPGHIYVAQPNHHLMVDGERVRVSSGPKENRFRPSVDVLFRSAAAAYGRRVIGLVLTGMLDDGASGLFSIKERGGITIVQDPVEAVYYDMPIAAMKSVNVDYVLTVAQMGGVLARLTNEVLGEEEEKPVSELMSAEVRIARQDDALEKGVTRFGEPSLFTCPECHGTLMQIKEGRHLRFRCHTGHAFSLNSLLLDVTQSIEEALWNSVRAIEESQMLLEHIANHFRENGQEEVAALFASKADKARRQGNIIRQAVMNNEILSKEQIMPSDESQQGESAAHE